MRKRVLAFVLMITMLAGNTLSVSAAPSVSGNIVDVVTQEEETSGETQESETLEEESVEMGSIVEDSSLEEESSVIEENSVEEEMSVEETEEVTTEETTTEEMTTEEETLVFEEAEVLPEAVVARDAGPIYQAYFGLPSALAPSASTSTSEEWSGEWIHWFGTTTSVTLDSYNAHTVDEWKILDPSKGLLWAGGILHNGSYNNMDSAKSDLSERYWKNDGFFSALDQSVIKDIRLLTKEEMMKTEYGFSNTESADNTRKLGSYSYQLDTGDSETGNWVTNEGAIAGSYNSSKVGQAPVIELDTDKIFMTVYSNIYGSYVGKDISDYDGRQWDLILKSGDTGFAATLPEKISWGGYFDVEVTGLAEGNEYDGISMVISDMDGNVLVYGAVDGYHSETYDGDTYISAPALGAFEFRLPDELAPGTYKLTVFEQHLDEINYANTTCESGYVSNVVEQQIEVVGPEIVDFEINYQEYGELHFTWDIENLDGVTYCNIYRSKSRDGEYELVKEYLECDGDDSYQFWTDTNVLNAVTGKNDTYYYKIRLSSSTEESGFSDIVTNEGMYYYYSSSHSEEEYVGMYLTTIGEDGELSDEVDSLTLRLDEYQELQLVLLKEDGSIVTDTIGAYEYDDFASCYICTEPVKNVTDAKEKMASESLLEIVPVDFEVDNCVGVVAHDTVVPGQTYYLMVQRDVVNVGRFWVQIPISIIEAEEGDSYIKLEGGKNGICLTADGLSKTMRADMVAREKTGVYYVKESVYETWAEAGGTNDVYDFNREREGMKPDEGDYLFWQNFDPEKIMSIQENKFVFTPTSFNGDNWWKIESNQVYFSTAEQEAAVTEKINYILKNPNGGLYSVYSQYYREDGNYTNEERKAIADACCSYVHRNTTYIGTPVPEYHSAYSAIMNGIGTCQAYSLYLTRLLREFGIANKILTGTDKNYHTYNIVQIDAKNDLWYYYDATGGINYKTESEFGRTQYQGLFLEDPLFIENYLSKIVGSSYSPQVYLYGDEALVGKYFTLETAVDGLTAHNAIAENADTHYRIELQKDADAGDGNAVLPASVAYCELDLNGHTLTVQNGMRLAVDKAYDGTFFMKIGSSMNIYVPENDAKETVYEKVKFNFEQANGGFYVNGEKASYVHQGYYDNIQPEMDSEVTFKNVTVGSCFAAELDGTIKMDAASSIKTGWLRLSNLDANGESEYLGPMNAQSVDIYSGKYDLGDVAVSGEATVRTNVTLNIRGNVSFGNTIINDWGDGVEAFVNIVQLLKENGEVTSTGTFTLNGTVIDYATDYTKPCYFLMGKQQVMVKNDGTESSPVSAKFNSGETIAIVKKDASIVPMDYFVLADAEEDESIIRNGTKLIAARITVKVHFTDENGIETTKEYISLENAVASMNTDFGGAKGSYTVTFTDDCKLNANITFPTCVLELHVKALGKDGQPAAHTLDLNGYTVSTGAVVNVYNDLLLTNTAQAVAKVTTTAKNGVDGYAFKVIGNADAEQTMHLSHITVTAANGTVVFESADTEKFHIADAEISAKEVVISSGKWELDTLSVSNFINNSITSVIKLNNVQNVDNKVGGTLIVDSYTQKTNGITNLESGSKLLIRLNAKIYNTVIGGTSAEKEDPVYVYRMSDYMDQNGADETVKCTVAFEGKVTSANGQKIAFGVLAPNAEAKSILVDSGDLSELKPRTQLFTTGIKAFPVELFTVNQGVETPLYSDVYQQDSNVYVGREWITIYAKQVSGEETELKRFIRWTDASAYLDTLSNTQMEYVVEISEDVELFTALTLPKNVKGITFRGVHPQGNAGDGRITLVYIGDIKLISDTTFENMDLVAKKYDSKTKSYLDYQSAVTLNGKILTMQNASASFASIAGNNKSKLVMESAQINVAKAVSGLGYLDMIGTAEVSGDGIATQDTVLTADNVTVTDTLKMQSAKIDCVNKIALKNIVTMDPYNMLSYGGNTGKDGLTITGNVSADDAQGMADETVRIRRNEENVSINQTVKVRKNAIELEVKSMESAGYTKDALLCTAEKAGAGWFVTGYEGTEGNPTMRVFTHGTYKVKNKEIHCGEMEENVKLYSSDSGEIGTYAYESGFTTLQDAFTEIDKLSATAKYYRIELDNAQENVVTFNSKAPTFPSKATKIVIAKGNEISSADFYFKGNLTLKCNTTFEDIIFVPETKSSISLGNYELHLKNCFVDSSRAGVEFSGITGSNVNGTSALVLEDTVLAVAGNVNNVGTLVFAGAEAAEPSNSMALYSIVQITPAYPKLTADGSVNVGTVKLDKDGYITGLATVTRKDEKVTKVTSQITINQDVISNEGHTLYLDVQEKVSGRFKALDFDSVEMTDVLNSGVTLAKALYSTYPNIKAEQRNNEASLIKSGGYLTYFVQGFGVMLSYENETNGAVVEIPCYSFADAVTEINNQKVKRNYTIALQPAITEISGADQSGAVPKALTMPNKNYVDTLTIQAPEQNDTVKLGFINNITLTSNVVLENVQFVQMMKVGSVYQTSDIAKDDFPGAMTLNTAGFAVTLKGENTFNTPLVMNGGNKTVLTFEEGGTITTLTNGYETQGGSNVVENVIYGSMTGFDTVNVEDCNLILQAYKTSSTATTYTESKNKITTVNVSGTVTQGGEVSGNIKVVSPAFKAEFTATNYNSDNGSLLVDGKVNLKNTTLEGEFAPTIHADTNFDITGNLVVNSNYSVLETRLKGAGKEPYLNISGTVVRVKDAQPIQVKVYSETTAANTEELVDMKNITAGKAVLLTAKNAQSADFKPADNNYRGGAYIPGEEGNSSGYMLLKQSGKIYVYNGETVNLAVYKGEYTGSQADELLGYYPSFKEATADVEALKDKTQSYTYVLTKTNGSMTAPASMTFPAQAENIKVTGLTECDENTVFYISGNVSLKCNTTFENIEFAPSNKKTGTAFSIAAGAYDVALQDVTISTESDAMALKDISGNGKGRVVLASPEFRMTGSITNAAEVVISEDAEIKTNMKATTLTLENNAQDAGTTITVNGTVTVDTLQNKGTAQNTLVYSRNASNKNPNLTINKEIVNERNPVVFKQQENATLTALTKAGAKVTLSNANKAFSLPKASTDSFVLQANCVTANGQTIGFTGSSEDYMVVKADKGVYLTDNTLKNDIVILKRTKTEIPADGSPETKVETETKCLDYSQAVNEINTLADAQFMNNAYEIQFLVTGSAAGAGSAIDTNVKDANPFGTFTLPKSNAKSELVIKGVENGTTILPFSGNISGQGTITLQNLVLNPVKSGTDATPADTKISITADKTIPCLAFVNVSTHEQSVASAKATGFIASISGTKNKTDLSLKDCGNLLVKSGISNVNTVFLDGTKLVSDGAVAVNNVELLKGSTWDSLGKMTVTDVYVETSQSGVSESYIGTKQDKGGHPQFIVNGDVYGIANDGEINRDAVLQCKVYTTDATIADTDAMVVGNSEKELVEYANKELVSAKKAGGDKFRAYPFRIASADGTIVGNEENITKENLVAYKDGVYVKNGNIDAMQIKLVEHVQSADGAIVSTSYAESWEDTVTTINNKADMNAYYEICFIQPGSKEQPVMIMTAKKGTAYGAFTLPTKAAGVTVSGYAMEENGVVIPCTVISYTGTLKASCDVVFENILLAQGKADSKQPDGFAESGIITPAPASNVTMTFGEDVYTWQNSVTESMNANYGLVVDAINAGKGHLVLNGNAVYIEKTNTLGSLTLSNGASFEAVGKVTITDLFADENADNRLVSQAAVSIGNIKKVDEQTANVSIQSDFTKITKAGAYGSSQLTISGEIENVNVKLNYRKYDLNLKTYVDMEVADYANLLMKADGKPDAYKKLATVTKASLDWIMIAAVEDMDGVYKAYDHNSNASQTYLYKYDTGLYLTDAKPVVLVNGYQKPAENEDVYVDENLCYQAEFLSWEQAVKEMDKIGNVNRYYEVILLDSIGYNDGLQKVDTPITNVTMPTKVAGILITSKAGEENGIFFTGTTMTLKCPVRMENVGFTCVKKQGSGANVSYQPITFTMNIGNFRLVQKDMINTFCQIGTIPYTVSGAAKGILELVADTVDNREFAAIKGMDKLIVNYTSARSEGDGYENFMVDCLVDVSVKNLIVNNSTVEAKNLTVSTLTTLDEAALIAGTSAANDGKVTLKDIVLVDNGNALQAEQNKSGATQLTINGTVTAAENAMEDALETGTLEVTLVYNNYQKGSNYQVPAQLYDGMILCTAQKAASSLFVPGYTQKDQSGNTIKNGMGFETDTHGIYKSGKNICYGKTEDTREVQLSIGTSGMTTYFATFEEAVKEMDSLSLYKDPTAKTKVYEDYTITLLKDVEIGNDKKNNSFSSMSLPAKADKLLIEGNENEISFNGNVTVRCNTTFSDIALYPIKNVKGQGVKTAVNYSIGNYTLELDNTVFKDESGLSLIGNVSGSSKSGTLKLAAGAEDMVNTVSISQLSGLREVVLEEYTQLHVDKNCSVYQLTFDNSMTDNSLTGEGQVQEVPLLEEEGVPVLSVDGNLTTTLINAEYAGEANGTYGIIRKPMASQMTVNGLNEDRDKDKVKEYYSLFFPENEADGSIRVEIKGSPVAAGTLILSGKNLLWDEMQDNIKVVSLSTDSECTTYAKGTSLYVGGKTE